MSTLTKAQKKANRERAQRAANTLAFYKHSQLSEGGPAGTEDLADLLADIRHYCDTQNKCHGDIDELAHCHYLAELDGE